MMPTNVAARMTLAADPASLQGAVAAGILGAGPVILGAAGECARLLEDARPRRGGSAAVARSTRIHAAGEQGSRASATRYTGRSTLAPSGSSSSRTRAASSGPHVALARRLRERVAEVWGKPLPMNVSLPIAAVMLDLGYSRRVVKAVPDPRADGGPARAPGRGAGEPARVPAGGEGRRGRRVRAPPSRDARRRRSRRAPGRSSSPSTTRATGPSSRYLLERSAFYREKLAAAGIESAAAAGGLEEIARLPLTEKSELRATVTPDNPIGSHLCAEPSEIVRIYSTSGTTGDAQLHPAHGARPRRLGHGLGSQLRRLGCRGRPADRLDLQRGAVRRRRRARVVRPPRALPRARGHGKHRAPAARDRAPPGRGRCADAVVRSASRRVGRRARSGSARVERPPRAGRRRAGWR